MQQVISRLSINGLVKKIINPLCVLCKAPAGSIYFFCDPCFQELPWAQNACPQCAQPLFTSQTCGACQQDPPPFNHTIVACDYRFPITSLIVKLKFQKQFIYGRILGELLKSRWDLVSFPKPDLFIPMPLHPQRLRERQFNQAFEIARPLAKAWGIPIANRACQRIKSTLPQSGLDMQLRQSNIKGAFVTSTSFANQHIAIVDDVLTTGNTVRELAKTLKKAGAARISVWCVARSLPMH